VAVLDPDRQEGELFVAALPAPAPDKSYQLWLFDSEHPAGASLAVFVVDSAGAEVTVPFKLDRASANGARYKISVERKDGAPVPEGPVVLASP
jgi:anti-sigma-K factor RskA